ncbi:MAG TPA: hypothetical protein VJ250_09175 [Nitrososphaeraceae archaeon]|nr:hypothetical protein [Nitrososphaeraceae archaeon]
MQWWKKQDEQQRRRNTTISKFNIISLSNASSPWHPRKLCPTHHAVLIPKRNDTTGEYEPGLLRCPLCGSTYIENEAFITTNEERVNSQ